MLPIPEVKLRPANGFLATKREDVISGVFSKIFFLKNSNIPGHCSTLHLWSMQSEALSVLDYYIRSNCRKPQKVGNEGRCVERQLALGFEQRKHKVHFHRIRATARALLQRVGEQGMQKCSRRSQ